MLAVWASCITAFYILPLQLENRTISMFGFLVLLSFLGAFCAGSLLAGRLGGKPAHQGPMIFNFGHADRMLKVACLIALIALGIDSYGSDLFDLGSAFEQRAETANALMGGGASTTSLMFQIAFLFYPAAYVLLVREIAFKPRFNFLTIGVLGIGPILGASLAMGGRFPLLYALVAAVLAYRLRRYVASKRVDKPSLGTLVRQLKRTPSVNKMGAGFKITAALAGTLITIYSAQVFLTRASYIGGVDGHLTYASTIWGVNFDGNFSELFFNGLGLEGTYLVFLTSWYAVQGFVMSNVIFTDYQGPMLLGTYGIDLAGALMRRLNGEYVAQSFFELVRINTYGFLPSAFGTLYIDFKYVGLAITALWGWGAAFVYLRSKEATDPRWLLVLPFVTMGIIFSLLNTPFGFANGFSTHLWLLATFLVTKARPAPSASPFRSHRHLERPTRSNS